MEDEDNENGVVDKWTLWEETYYKEQGIDTSLAQINNSNVSLDDIDETREDCFYSSYPQDSGGNGNSNADLKNVIKGIKKNILKAQPEENQAVSLNDNASTEQPAQVIDTSKDKTNDMVEVKDNNMTEYAQYLGLQPAATRSECSKCKSINSVGQDECNCSAEDIPQVDADSCKLSLVNNVDWPSTSSNCKLPCTENSQSSSLDNAELLPANDCHSPPAGNSLSPSAETNQSELAHLSMSPSADESKVPCTDGSKSPEAESPRSPVAEKHISSPAGAPHSPAPETDELEPMEVSESPAPETLQSPAPETIQSPPSEAPQSPAPEAIQSPAPETNQSPPSEASQSPAPEIIQSPHSEAPQSPAPEIIQSPHSEVPQSPASEKIQFPPMEAPESPAASETDQCELMDISESPAPETVDSPPMATPHSPAPETVQSPTTETSELPPADVPMEPEETFQPPSVETLMDEASQASSAETSPSPSVEVSPSPSVEASPSPSVEESPSPSVEASPSPSVEESPSPSVESSPSPSVEASPSRSGDVCMSPATETPKSPSVDVPESSIADAFDTSSLPIPVSSADASQSPVSNDLEHFSNDSPKPQTAGSESPASSSRFRTTNISESVSCDSTEMPPAESSQSPPQVNTELSGDSSPKELQIDTSEIAMDKYEPVASTSYQEPTPTPLARSCEPLPSKTLKPSKSKGQSKNQPKNFKVTSKVYFCAACETYFENWNLFTHMREVHQRHICLFCLAMFAQADKLSQHLLKKHNIPDMNFSSPEEFFKVFIGPCCVVCYKCDKMFSNNEHFNNHSCQTQEAVQSTSGVCSQCKQINSHVDGCRLAPAKSDNKKVSKSLPSSSRTKKVEPTKTNQTVTNVIRHSKRTIKPNRYNEDIYLYTKLTNIRTKRTKLQSTSEASDCSDTHRDASASDTRELTWNSFSENAMAEVGTGADDRDSFDNNQCAAFDALENHEREDASFSRVSAKDTYDSVTETIMNVSGGTNCNDSTQNDKLSNTIENTLDCSTSKGTVESSEPKDEDDVRLKEKNVRFDETKELNVEHDSLNDANENYNSDSESQASHSSSNAADESFDNDYKVPTPTKSEPSKPVMSATPVTDRSLVIKIFTRNNSMYSIKTPTPVENNIENHDSSRESEENNNAEDSDKAPTADESMKSLQDASLDDEKMHVTENGENDDNNLGSINFDLDVNKENKSDNDNQLDDENDESSIVDEKLADGVEDKVESFDGIPLAGEEIAVVDVEVDDLLENMELEELLKRCIKAVCGICVYCNHARHIAVNGKELSLHMLSEHRFQPQHPAIVINQEQFIAKVKKCFNELETYFFNLDSYNSKQGTYHVSNVKNYECFHCRFYSNSHKELYLHNRKMHQKAILICIMCKSTFLSYSELLCHLCPGVYAANVDILYRCCLCEVSNIPSSFRLMVHLRKVHNACDVCLETTGNQQNLSNHVWKHKLHHLCYRCGIAYRNKPDITKHLFWKHGTESVLCKKCLQKKWPYIYHFCVPPSDFHCEECGFTCSKAVALKVHKRVHANEFPYACSECPEKLISKKLLAKHEKNHREPELPPPPPTPPAAPPNPNENDTAEEDVHVDVCDTEVKENETVEINPEVTPKEQPPAKKVVDVLDLPPLNLSDSDSDSDDEKEKPEESKSNEEPSEKIETADEVDKPETVVSEPPVVTESTNDTVVEAQRDEEVKKQEEQIMDGIWDNFRSYAASLEKQEAMEVDGEKKENAKTKEEIEHLNKVILAEHDYCVVYPNKGEEGQSPSNTSKKTDDNVEADKTNLPVERTPSPSAAVAATNSSNSNSKERKAESESPKKKVKSPKKKKQNTSASSSDSSSDSDSSNCSCGTDCSCSSSSSSGSSSSSSSSDSDSSTSPESPKKANREKRKKGRTAVAKLEEKNETIEEAQTEAKQDTIEVTDDIEPTPVEPPKPVIPVLVIRESDLETTETDTDEEFYDENPQKTANKLLEEKRKQTLLASGMTDEAPPQVNGVIDTHSSTTQSAAASPSQVETPSAPATKRKFKTRKRRKGLWGKARNPPVKTVESIKINIPKSSYQRRGAPRGRRHSTVSNVSASAYEPNPMMTPEATPFARTQSLGGSGSEMDTTRSSKRKRVPKRFYDDSSDEENHMQRMLKWRRTDAPPMMNTPSPSSSKALNKQSFQQQQQLLLQQQQQQQQLLIQQQQQLIMQQHQQQLIIQQQQQQLQYQQEQLLQAQRQQQQQQQQQHRNADYEDEDSALVIAASESDSNDSSSSDSSDSDNETTGAKNEVPALAAAATAHQTIAANAATLFHSNYPQLHPIIPERSNNLYCYCQCPYDEVSEMIACDGDDCQIEWFHFECVGISVPPKGKWFCPDCRKNLGMSDEEMING